MKLKKGPKIALTVLGVAAVAGLTVLLLTFFSGKKVEVTNFVGMTKAEVETWRKENNIPSSMVIYEKQFDEKVEKDTIIKQSIKGGDKMDEDTYLTITLSDGPDPEKEFELPDFTDQKEEEVKKWFEDNAFTNVVYTHEHSEEKEDGTFLSITPEASTTVKRSDEIHVVFVGEPEKNPVQVIDFTGMNRSQIEAWATENQILLSISYQVSTTVEKEVFISSTAAPDTTIYTGDTIGIILSRGTEENQQEITQKNESDNASSASSEVANSQVTQEQTQQNTEPAPAPEPVAPTEYPLPSNLVNLDWSDGMTSDKIKDYVNQLVAGAGIPGSVNYVVNRGAENPGINSVQSPSTVTDASQITVIIDEIN